MKSSIIIEEWRDIVGYEGLYQVSNLGRVKRIVGWKCLKTRLRNLSNDKDGYQIIQLCKNSVYAPMKIHRLVGIMFPDLVSWTEDAKGKPFDKLQINHKNECKWDNNYWNLEWCTREYNNNYGTRITRMKENKKGKFNTKKSKPVIQYTIDMKYVTEYPSVTEAERQTGIHHGNICQCCKGNINYSHAGGFIWKYQGVEENKQENLTELE